MCFESETITIEKLIKYSTVRLVADKSDDSIICVIKGIFEALK